MKGDTMERKTIKLYDGRVYTKDGEKAIPQTCTSVFHIPDNKIDVIRHLMAFGTLDLTEAYRGRKVVFTLYRE